MCIGEVKCLGVHRSPGFSIAGTQNGTKLELEPILGLEGYLEGFDFLACIHVHVVTSMKYFMPTLHVPPHLTLSSSSPGHADVAALLLEYDANKDCRTKTGITPLFQLSEPPHMLSLCS